MQTPYQPQIELTDGLQSRQRDNPGDMAVAHDLGLLHFWMASVRSSPIAAEVELDHWHKVIANWGMLFGDDVYWEVRAGERSLCYGETIAEDALQTARRLITERVIKCLVEYDQVHPPGPEEVSLETLFHLEVKANQLLREWSGFQVQADSQEKLFCGPLMARHLGIGTHIGQVMHRLADAQEEEDDLLRLLRTMLTGVGDAPDIVDSLDKRRLMMCFSQLGAAYASLDLLNNPDKTLALLAGLSCSDCDGYSDVSIGQNLLLVVPRTCNERCPSFVDRNPAYEAVPHRGQHLFRHAVELMAQAHMTLAEQSIRAQPPIVADATRHWQNALKVSELIGIEAQLRDVLVTTALGRTTTLVQNQQFDESVALLQTVYPLTDDERIQGRLAEVLTDRGVKRGNRSEWDGAVEDLRSALTINPHSVRARSNLVTALRGAAALAHETGNKSSARFHLDEARSVLSSGLEMDGDKSEWQQELLETELEMIVIGGESGEDGSGGPAELLGGLLAVFGSREDGADSAGAEAMRLMAEAADRAAAQDFAEALQLTERALELAPDSPLLLRGLASMTNNYGVQLAEQEQFERAIQVLEGGLRRFPDNADLQRNLQGVRHAHNLHRLTSEGSPLEALEALLRVLAEEPDKAARPQQDLPRLAPPATVLHRATELAERGRAKSGQGDLPGAIADLEEALSLAPENQDVRQSLADTLEKHADSLIAQGKRDEGLAVARRGLMYMPAHAGLKMTVTLTPLSQPGAAASGSDVTTPETMLRTLFDDLAKAVASAAGDVQPLKDGPADPGAVAKAGALLRETGLKYQEPGPNRYALPFRTEHRDRLVAQLQVVRDLAVVSVPVPVGLFDEADLLYSLLRATYAGDYFKVCRSQQGGLFLLAETPLSVLSAKSLEEIIRDAIGFADVSDADLASADKMAAHIDAIQGARRLEEGLADGSGGGLFGLFRRVKGMAESAQRLVDFCRASNVKCDRVADNRYQLEVGLANLTVLAICKGSAVSFVAILGDMRPARGNLRFYRRVAEINMELEVWKIALDSDDDVAFLYELPSLDEDAFERMTDGLDQYLMRYGFELMLLARSGV